MNPPRTQHGNRKKRHMKMRICIIVLGLSACIISSSHASDLRSLYGRENLARKAKATASAELNETYSAECAIDGKIPERGCQSDACEAWCVNGQANNQTAEFVLEWDEETAIAEVVYYGRTAFEMGECWKDYAVYPGDAEKPVARGRLEKTDGPQRIRFQPTITRKITLKFESSYNGSNPGASEIMVYADSPPDEELRERESAIEAAERLEAFDGDALQTTIASLAEAYPAEYSKRQEHENRLALLLKERTAILEACGRGEPEALKTAAETAAELNELTRSVLLFDINEILLIKRHEINASHVYTYHYEGFRAGGGLYALNPHDPAAKPRLLVNAGEGQMLDCELSYDAREILFSWRVKEDAGYHLFKTSLQTNNVQQITDGPWHDYNGCWLPDGGIAFISSRESRFAYCWHAPVGVLHRMDGDGENILRLSSNIINDFTPSVLPDGRILYSRWEYVDRPAIPIQSMWSINPDGTGLAVYYGNRVLTPGTFMEARAIPGTDQVLCTMTGHNGPTRGATGIIDRSRGVNAQEAICNLTPDVDIGTVTTGNGNMDMGQWGRPVNQPYGTPFPLDDLRYLVSRFGTVMVRDYSGKCQAVVAKPDDGMWHYCAQPVRPRRQPPVIPSTLPEKPDDYATIFAQDIYNGLGPYVKRGEIAEIRVVWEMKKTVRIDPALRAFGFQFPVISCGATYAGKRVLGHVPVEKDGSACFKVPAGAPLYFMAVDRHGRAVQRMRSFTHFMPGEVQGCIGCHESRLHTSPGTGKSIAFQKPARDLTPPEWGTEGFDYSSVVQPVFDRYCTSCHNPANPPRGIDLSGAKTDFFNVSYDILAREKQGPRGTEFVNWIPTYNGQEQNILEIAPNAWGSPRSKLAGLILAGHPDSQGKPRIQMDEASRRRVFAWIDLNVPYYGTPETAYPEKTGCRQLYPAELDACLKDISERRCAGCHNEGVPRREWTRITEPEYNDFLMAPLAKSAGGRETCGEIIFASANDPDYRAILRCFDPILLTLKQTPRMDMPGAAASCTVDRSRY